MFNQLNVVLQQPALHPLELALALELDHTRDNHLVSAAMEVDDDGIVDNPTPLAPRYSQSCQHRPPAPSKIHVHATIDIVLHQPQPILHPLEYTADI
jgi:hypothetical protein